MVQRKRLRLSQLLFLVLIVAAIVLGKTQLLKRLATPGQRQSVPTLQRYLQDQVPFNVLLLGFAGGTHEGAYLTDSMMVVHLDPKRKLATLISIPRDIWVKIPTNGTDGSYWKINAAYELGGDDADYPNKLDRFQGQNGAGNLAKYMVEQVTGLPMNNFVASDFAGFKKSIDQLGGVDVNVETTLDDFEYPVDGKEDDTCSFSPDEIISRQATMSAVDAFPCRYQRIHFDAGPQHMNGDQALQYVRSRHSQQDGTDFGRAKRQRNLIVVVKDKVLNLKSLPNLIPFVLSLKDDLKTDFNIDDVYAAISSINLLKGYAVRTYALTGNFLVDRQSDDGQAILIPQAGLDQWGEVHQWTGNITTSASTSSAVVAVQNGTDIPGLAELAANRLKDRGFNAIVTTIQPSIALNTSQIIVYDPNLSAENISALEKELGVNGSEQAAPLGNAYQALVIVGRDYNLRQGKKIIN